ncbi:Hypothetical predicted protein, partial [Mytilus galloprovincialis]
NNVSVQYWNVRGVDCSTDGDSGLPVNDVDMNKYKENRVTKNIRNLTISDFDFSDIQNYTCVHALESALLDLTSEAYTFVFLNNSTSIETRLHGNLTIVDLFNVSPVPTCSVFLKNRYIPMTEYSIYKDVYLYNVSFKLNMECSNEDIITYVKCDIGGLNLNTTVKINCQSSDEKTNQQTLVITVVVIAVVIVISVTLIIVRYNVKAKKGIVTKMLNVDGIDSDADNTTNAEPLLDKHESSIDIQS